MNIYLGEKSKAILDDENALKQSLAEFLKIDENSSLIAKLMMRLKLSRLNPDLLAIPFMSLGFSIWAGIFTSFLFIYRRLYLGFLISFLSSIAFSMIFGFFAIIPFLISVFVFGKLYEYFLIKKFIDTLNTGMPVANKCAPNIVGVVVLAILDILYLAFLLFVVFAVFSGVKSLVDIGDIKNLESTSSVKRIEKVRNDKEIAKGLTNLSVVVGDLMSYYTSKGTFATDIYYVTNVNLGSNGELYVDNQPCIKISTTKDKIIFTNDNINANINCNEVLKRAIKMIDADLTQVKSSEMDLSKSGVQW